MTDDLGSGRACGARYFRGGQRGHIAGNADLGSDNHYGVLGERATKQSITDGYNDEDADGSGNREAAIVRLMARHPQCEQCVCYIDVGSESRLTQLHGRASVDLRVHHKDSWFLTNTQKSQVTVTDADTGRGNNAALRWCFVRMEDGRCVAVFWIEPNTNQYAAWVKPGVAGGSGGGAAGATGPSDGDSLSGDSSSSSRNSSRRGSAASIPLDSAQGHAADKQSMH